MLLHRFNVYDALVFGFKHADVNLKCPNCGFFTVFGVPISEDEMFRLKESPLHGKVITDEAPEIAELQELPKEQIAVIKQRLKSWGYW